MADMEQPEKLTAEEYLGMLLQSDPTNGDIFRCIWSEDTPKSWQARLTAVYNLIDTCLTPLFESDTVSNWPAIAEALLASGLMVLSCLPWMDGTKAPDHGNPAARKAHMLRILNISMPTLINQTFKAFEASGRKHRVEETVDAA